MNKIKIILKFLFNKKGVLRELEVLRDALNRRVYVENEMARWLVKNGNSPDAPFVRECMIKLGRPEKI